MGLDRAFSEHWELIREVLEKQVKQRRITYSTHAIERMEEQNILEEDVEYVLSTYAPHEMFKPYEYPYGPKPFSNRDPVFSVFGKTENLVVAVALKKIQRGVKFVVVTAFRPSEHSGWC